MLIEAVIKATKSLTSIGFIRGSQRKLINTKSTLPSLVVLESTVMTGLSRS